MKRLMKNVSRKRDGSVNIITGTRCDIQEKEWSDIGKKRMWIRSCPQCNNDVFCGSESYRNDAIKKKRLCKKCHHSNRIKTTAEFIKNAKVVHGDKYNYKNSIYTRSNSALEIICSKHGTFYQNANSHLCGQGCKRCASLGLANTKPEFIFSAKKIHGNKYDYSLCVYKNNKKNIQIICPEHGPFWQMPTKHILRGHGCPECAGNIKCDTKIFIKKSLAVHGNKYDYSQVAYKNNKTKIVIICPMHGKFPQVPGKHLFGQGCPRCWHGISKMEKEFLKYMKIKNQHYQIREWRIKYVDGFDKDTNTVYEFLGDYWHGNPAIYKQTQLHPGNKNKTFGELFDETFNKFDRLVRLGYTVKYIWEMDWKFFLRNKDTQPKIHVHKCLK